MCCRIAFSSNEISEQDLLSAGIVPNNGVCEVDYRNKKPILPVEINGKKRLIEWGNRDNKLSKLPRTAWAKKESIDAGKWAWLYPEKIKIIASRGFEKGIWFKIKEGIEGLLIIDENKEEHVYMITRKATHYFETMTHHDRMPVLINEWL